MNGPDQRVTIVDLRIPFFRLMLFFVKATLAAIPAAIIVTVIISILAAIIAFVMVTMGWGNWQMLMQRWTL